MMKCVIILVILLVSSFQTD
ncbi:MULTISPECIES: type I toxin-antitoxin system Ibs family toxin [Citrobacter]|nr:MULTISPECIES: type I toxin-antitoxin system Ibs family toxin [Citrobacter]MBE0023451.1 type I toxin-antitoxin system Ibs family toxin [Citrobacter koseri]MBE0084155.1 type I toxin-antitoxin system Ibs family toxin [Citrobacter koseri]MBJ8809047.1 type I toxin-antitoxin system Ibs family toxin [Citrobacter koseri]MBJ9343947.1 type I toxin-antitoxin system Ibs family toxin [Citrobacter koseri]MDM2965050.1 type I toxin-antitoxin system Ibs family toxin [Citrobacter sp. CK201]